jgi:16S rRNA (adenine1518-N6/adenine1519-N6)-dimethyltransferase
MKTEIKAKKKYGQNFLKDESILHKIIEAMPNNDNHIVEIGPGLGDLTKFLVKYKDVSAYEVDEELYEILQAQFVPHIQSGRLEIFLGDVLEKFQTSDSLYSSRYDLVANLPYYIATNIILQAFEDEHCEHILVMVQKEVADKFIATCGEKEFSSLGVITNLISSEAKIICDVPPESFDPIPKVDSAVLYIKKDLSIKLEDEFKKFLKVAFSAPRKKLIKNLSSRYDKAFLSDLFKELDLEENIRPHELLASLYRQIFKRVKEEDDRKNSRKNQK